MTDKLINPVAKTKLKFNDKPETVWLRVRDAYGLIYDRNPKLHDIGAIISSIERHGFKEEPVFDSTLQAIQHGNGRIEVLWTMEQDGGYKVPRGIAVERETGFWCMPVRTGVDSRSMAEAQAYVIDANNLTLMGGDFNLWDMTRIWDDSYKGFLAELAEDDALPVSVDGDALDGLLKEFNPDEIEFPEYDEGIADDVEFIECPSCGHKFPK